MKNQHLILFYASLALEVLLIAIVSYMIGRDEHSGKGITLSCTMLGFAFVGLILSLVQNHLYLKKFESGDTENILKDRIK